MIKITIEITNDKSPIIWGESWKNFFNKDHFQTLYPKWRERQIEKGLWENPPPPKCNRNINA